MKEDQLCTVSDCTNKAELGQINGPPWLCHKHVEELGKVIKGITEMLKAKEWFNHG